MSWSSSSRAVVVTANAATMKRSVLALRRIWKLWLVMKLSSGLNKWQVMISVIWSRPQEAVDVEDRGRRVGGKMPILYSEDAHRAYFSKGGKVEWMPRAFLRFRGNKFCFRVFIFFATLNWGIRKFLTKSRYKTEIFFIDYLRLFLSKFRNLFRRNDSFLSNGDFFSFMSKMIRIRRYVHT